MKKINALVAAGFLALSTILLAACSPEPSGNKSLNSITSVTPITQTTMKLASPVFKPNDKIPAKYTCDGQDLSPPLQIADVPTQAKSLVLIVDDPDAPGGDFVHWTIWNIDPKTTVIAENSLPTGIASAGTDSALAIEGKTDFGKNGWGGPCPPSGIHHYHFKLFALDAVLDLKTSAAKNEIKKAMHGHVLAQTELVGLYQRAKS